MATNRFCLIEFQSMVWLDVFLHTFILENMTILEI